MNAERTLIVGNWKMHLNVQQASLLVNRLNKQIKPLRTVEVVLAPSLLALQPVSLEVDRRKFRLAAQNAFYKDEGAYTGEVSFTMLREIAHYVIVGHSERRIYFEETLEIVRDKVAAAVRNELTPILCVGETKHEREAGETRRVIHDQIATALSNLTPEEVEGIVIAYEPIWAISTFGGELAKPDEIEKEFERIRAEISELYGMKAADSVRLLYGGSVNADTAAGYLAAKGCDGLLVGAASLNYKQFGGIVDSAYKASHQPEKDHDEK
ncbi:MAG TPA: triose-phosphate isomerase [Candidatus Saccharimonadales bacterium]|nr:triose-phosphate isomerase [Candidatus Saccharimonadales bacterium]